MYTRLKEETWKNIDDEVKQALPKPSAIVGALSLIMRLKGCFPRHFHFSDFKYLVAAVSFIIRTSRRSIRGFNKALLRSRQLDRCLSIKL